MLAAKSLFVGCQQGAKAALPLPSNASQTIFSLPIGSPLTFLDVKRLFFGTFIRRFETGLEYYRLQLGLNLNMLCF